MTTNEDRRLEATKDSHAAIVQDAYGSADVLSLSMIQRPTIEPNQVLIEVHTAGLDRGVEHLTTGLPYVIRIMGYGFLKPKNRVPGLDVAGRVIAVGDDVTRFVVGDEVFGIAKGSYAMFAAADEAKLAIKPASVTFEQAGVAAVSGTTALQALTTVADVQPGDDVLVIGASGGVGSYAVQIAKDLGATVTGVASTPKVEFVRSLGADHVVDYTQEDFVGGSAGFDVIVDIGGRNSLSRLRSALSPTGTLVIVGGEGGGRIAGGIGRQLRALVVSPFTKQRLTMFIAKESHESMEQLAEYIERGAVTPAIGQRFPLADAPEAMRQMGAGEITGKAVIAVHGDPTLKE